MKPTAYLFFIPLLFFSIFSCKKSDDALARVKAKTVMDTPEDSTSNVRVALSTPSSEVPYAEVAIMSAWDESAPPLEVRPVTTSSSTITLLFFSVLPGEYYRVRVTDETGMRYFSTPVTASTDMLTYRFPAEAPLPLLPTTPPEAWTPPSGPEEPDDSTEPGTQQLTVFVGNRSPEKIVKATILAADMVSVIKEKKMDYDSLTMTMYKTSVRINLTPATHFYLALTDKKGARTISSEMVVPNYAFNYYVF